MVIHDFVNDDVLVDGEGVWGAGGGCGGGEPGVVVEATGASLAGLGIGKGVEVWPEEEEWFTGGDGEGKLRGVDEEEAAGGDGGGGKEILSGGVASDGNEIAVGIKSLVAGVDEFDPEWFGGAGDFVKEEF